jgi:PKD repeat protein
MTWGRKYGGQQCIGSYCSPDFTDYEHMQDSLEAAYMRNALQNDASVSPVGISWKNSILNGDPIDLFAPDNSHPSEAGFYLSACTFYAAVFLESPVGLDYHAGLDPDDALYLQQIAEFTVLTNPGQWFLQPLEKPIAGFDYEVSSDSVYFFDTSQNTLHYFWDFGDGNTDTTQNPYHVYNQTGFYNVKQYVYDSCNADSTAKMVNVIVSGIDEDLEYELSFYPNPAKDYINCRLSIVGFQCQIWIYDIFGGIADIIEVASQQQDARLDLSGFIPGIYFAEVRSKKGVAAMGKFVKY